MKRIVSAMFVVVMLFSVISLTGCSKHTSVTETIEVTVVKCEEGRFVNNAAYVSMANSAMVRKQYAQYSTYMALARSTGKQKYNVYFEHEGVEYDVEVDEEIDTDTTITVKKTTVLDEEGQIVKIYFS